MARWINFAFALLTVLAAAIPVSASTSLAQENNPQPADALASAALIATFNETVLPMSSDELANPDRGEYVWYGHATDPQGWPWLDSYTRFDWRQLEPSRDAYDFSAIDRELARAAAHGGRFGFRVMTVDSYRGGSLVPDYLVNTSNGFWYPAEAGRPKTFLPDWNNENYISRYAALMQALGARYGADPRVGLLDIGGYGNYGEWHVYPFSGAYPGPGGQTTISSGNAARLIDATISAFPNHPMVMLTPEHDALAYAMDRSPLIGIRVDCLGGSDSMFGATDNIAAVPAAQTRWMTAPFVTEWCGNAVPRSGVFNTGDAQVSAYHVSMLSSGNYAKPFESFTQAERDAYVHADKVAGYRLLVDQLLAPVAVITGQTFTLTTQWENVNVAPTYRPWTTTLQFRDPQSGGVAWQATSDLDLRTILPTNGSPVGHTDTFDLPQTIAAGTYDVSVQVTDPDGISPPMQLGMAGRAGDGSYRIGSVTVIAPQ